jgi:hypothetical protein
VYIHVENVQLIWQNLVCRESIPVEEEEEIFADVHAELHQLEVTRKKFKRKRTFVKPKKTG